MKLAWIMLPAIAVIVPLSIWHDAPTPEQGKAVGMETCKAKWAELGLDKQFGSRVCRCVYEEAGRQGAVDRFSGAIDGTQETLRPLLAHCSRINGITWGEG